MPVLNGLVDVIYSFDLEGEFTVLRRTSQGPDKFGEEQPPIETPVEIEPLTGHPIVGKERKLSTHGAMDKETIVLFSEERLRTGKGGSDEMADIVLYDAIDDGNVERYLVHISEPWVKQSGHWRSYATREETDD